MTPTTLLPILGASVYAAVCYLWVHERSRHAATRKAYETMTDCYNEESAQALVRNGEIVSLKLHHDQQKRVWTNEITTLRARIDKLKERVETAAAMHESDRWLWNRRHEAHLNFCLTAVELLGWANAQIAALNSRNGRLMKQIQTERKSDV